ncbi:hypothetical protein FISHEDRAFT_66762 [Fistulina hepatica ATCC 64428]|uniref:Complex 1 LYR protein domain-containing protein n=1 Tax=Fistulina hepatica ATCC 64428 TaxID=1128425 RepID=A0A0D7A3S8_9AGAR|nr:hypothetical protein FISHEDRAFT_66762 [Fistulina hepatica ATCC 64428]
MSYTIPSRLAEAARRSVSHEEANIRALRLYRAWLRGAPTVVSQYALPISVAHFRHAIRQRFEMNRHVTDLKAIDVLLLKGHQDYQETMNTWKLRDHVMGILLKSQERPQKTFMQKFLEGRDDEAIIPAASGVH